MLASASLARARLLTDAGLAFEACPAAIDELAVKRGAAGAGAAEIALRLARLKAQAVPRPGALVLGCDQILVCGDTWFDKPADLAAARTHLQALRGRVHSLATAISAWRDGEEIWHHQASPRLTMRPFTDAFLDTYLAAEGSQILTSVGAYRLEGRGIQLFDAIEGEYAAILGLPMLPLLAFLRSRELLPT